MLESDGWLRLHAASGFLKLEDLREQVPLSETPFASFFSGVASVRTLAPQAGHALFRSPDVAAAIRYLAGAPVGGGDLWPVGSAASNILV